MSFESDDMIIPPAIVKKVDSLPFTGLPDSKAFYIVTWAGVTCFLCFTRKMKKNSVKRLIEGFENDKVFVFNTNNPNVEDFVEYVVIMYITSGYIEIKDYKSI
jgi:hypothetical protein